MYDPSPWSPNLLCASLNREGFIWWYSLSCASNHHSSHAEQNDPSLVRRWIYHEARDMRAAEWTLRYVLWNTSYVSRSVANRLKSLTANDEAIWNLNSKVWGTYDHEHVEFHDFYIQSLVEIRVDRVSKWTDLNNVVVNIIKVSIFWLKNNDLLSSSRKGWTRWSNRALDWPSPFFYPCSARIWIFSASANLPWLAETKIIDRIYRRYHHQLLKLSSSRCVRSMDSSRA